MLLTFSRKLATRHGIQTSIDQSITASMQIHLSLSPFFQISSSDVTAGLARQIIRLCQLSLLPSESSSSTHELSSTSMLLLWSPLCSLQAQDVFPRCFQMSNSETRKPGTQQFTCLSNRCGRSKRCCAHIHEAAARQCPHARHLRRSRRELVSRAEHHQQILQQETVIKYLPQIYISAAWQHTYYTPKPFESQ